MLLALLVALALAVYLVMARSEVSSLRWRLALLGQGEALNRPAGTDDTPVRVLLRPGQSAASLAAGTWRRPSLIHSERLFLAHLRAEGLDRRLVAGEYYLDSTRSIVAVAAALGALGSSPFPYPALVAQDAGPRVRFTVAAGETVAGIGQRLLAAGCHRRRGFLRALYGAQPGWRRRSSRPFISSRPRSISARSLIA